ncbi:MAG: hypothetical protein VW270_07800 [Candidatus Poseidoniales archaeon]
MPAGIERERRFLVDGRGEKPWRSNSDKVEIKQYYIDSGRVSLEKTHLMYGNIQVVELTSDEIETFLKSEVWVFRLRRWNEDYLITGKSKITTDSAYELERQIDEEIARKILDDRVYPMVSKTRYIHMFEDQFRWEVDEFEGEDLFTKFGIEVRKQVRFIMPNRAFKQRVPSEYKRPREGDILCLSNFKALFEIKFVNE